MKHRHAWEIRFRGFEIVGVCVNNPSPTTNSDNLCFAQIDREEIQRMINKTETTEDIEHRIKGEIIAYLTE